MEAAAKTQPDEGPAEGVSSFAKSLFLGEIHEELVFPYPKPAADEQERIRGLCASLREMGRGLRPVQDRGGPLDRRRQHRRARRARADGAVRAAGVRRPRALADRLLPRLGGFREGRRDALGDHGRAPVDRDEGHRHVRQRRAEGALPARPDRRPQARRVRADRAGRRLRRARDADTRRARGRRRLAAGRDEALHRQRRQGLRVRHLRRDRGRRQAAPHRVHRREGDEGLRGRPPLRHDGPARKRPPRAALQRRAGAAGERARRAGRGLQDRDADPQQRPDEPRHRLGRRGEAPARPDDRPRQGAQAVRPPARRLRARPGQGRLDGRLPLRARVDGLPDAGPRRRGRARLLARVGDREGRRHRVPLVPGQSRPAAQGRRRLHARPAVREDPARHPDLPDLRGRQRRDAGVHRAVGDEAGGREALRARARSGSTTRSARSACSPTTSPGGSRPRCARTR